MHTFNHFAFRAAATSAVALSVLSFAVPASAADLSKLTITQSASVNKDCLVSDGYDPVWGCFVNRYVAVAGQEALAPKPTIYLRNDLPGALLPYVLFNSIGQYLAMPYSDQELANVFNPAVDQFGSQDVRKSAASTFAYWALGGTITPQKLNFFREAFNR